MARGWHRARIQKPQLGPHRLHYLFVELHSVSRYDRPMRSFHFTVVLGALLIAAPVSAKPSLVGYYRAAEGPDVGGGLLIGANGRFRYALAAGALDERAEGRWERQGAKICLTTEPTPVPPEFKRAPDAAGNDRTATVMVSWPDGRGIAGVDFVIGFDTGDPLTGYTQYDGWTMPPDELRTPRWIELREPVNNVKSPRFTLDEHDHGKLHAVLIPHDIGVVNFEGACLEQSASGFVLHRKEGDMRFQRDRR